jgi:selenocysteine-specific elongation factor
MPIDRVFTVAGHGTVITGTLARGKVRVGAEAEVMPGRHRVRIRSIQVHGHPADAVEAGRRTAMNVVGIKKEDLHRGQAIAAPGTLEESTILNVRLTPVAELKHGIRVRVHLGAGEFIGKLFLFDHAPEVGQLRLESPVACARGQRAVIRRYSPPTLLAGAEVITPHASKRRKNDPTIQQLLEPIEESSQQERILQELRKHPLGAETRVLCEALGETQQSLGDAFEELKASERALSFAGIWMAAENEEAIAEKTLAALTQLHEAHPTSPAIPKTDLLRAVALPWNPKAFDRFVQRMSEKGRVVLQGEAVRLPDFQVQLSEKQEKLLERVLATMEARGAAAPSVKEIAEELRIPTQAVEEMVRLGLALGRMVKVEEGLVYSTRTIEELKQKARSIGPRFTAAAFRDATGSSRKYAIPLLEYFDSIRFTRRTGDDRVIVE